MTKLEQLELKQQEAQAELTKAAARLRCEVVDAVRRALDGCAGTRTGICIDCPRTPELVHIRGSEDADVCVRLEKRFATKKRSVEMDSVSSRCSFGADNARNVAYYTLVGAVASRLADITRELMALDYSEYDAAERAAWDACDAFCAERDRADAEKEEAALAEVGAKLVPGASICTKKWYDGSKIICNVERITPKRVYCSGAGKSVFDRKDVCRKLLSGSWELV